LVADVVCEVVFVLLVVALFFLALLLRGEFAGAAADGAKAKNAIIIMSSGISEFISPAILLTF
jgi:hypothetical protein